MKLIDVLAAVVVLLVPLFGFLINYLWGPSKDTLQESPGDLTPPGYVFGVVWGALYLLLGIVVARQFYVQEERPIVARAILLALIPTLYIWPVVYEHAGPKTALYHLYLALFLALLCYTALGKTSQLLFVPLVPWLVFAGVLASNQIRGP